MITTIEPLHFKTLKLASDAIVIDVRNRKEQYEEGQISGNITLEMGTNYFYEQLEELDKSKRYLVYCRSGNRSLQVCEQMDSMGFEEVYSLNGGIIKWKEIFG
ncbi:MAG: rhodanese-like domain-containing protein [Cyclobacteriaceae bacterium]|nr:rhodanese-like domain-containing protein [Cyclobacteriaceae bacterium]